MMVEENDQSISKLTPMAAGEESPAEGAVELGESYREVERVQRLNLLLHLMPYGGIFLVLGERLIGKTLLMKEFVARSPEQFKINCIAATKGLNSATFLEQIISNFGLRGGRGESASLEMLGEKFRAWKEQGALPVLVIDDAHLMSDDLFLLLLKLAHSGRPAERVLSIVLFAEPGLEQRLAEPDMRLFQSRVTHSFDLQPFSNIDIQKYVRFKLAQYGRLQGKAAIDGALSASLQKYIQVASRGVPGKIDQLLQDILQSRRAAFVAEEVDIPLPASLRKKKMKTAPLLLLSIVAMVALVFRNDIGGWVASDPLTGLLVSLSQRAEVLMEPVAMPQPASTVEQRLAAAFEQRKEPQEPVGQSSVVQAKESPQNVDNIPLVDVKRLASLDLDQNSDLGSDDAVIVESHGDVPSKPAVSGGKVAGKLMDTLAIRDGGRKVGSQPVSVIVAEKSGHVAPATRVYGVSDNRINLDETWLGSRSKQRFTLQLLAMKRESAHNFVRKHALESQVHYYRTQGLGGDLVAVSLGDFATQKQAERARARWQNKMPGVKPWVRTFASVVKAMQGGQYLKSGSSSVIERNRVVKQGLPAMSLPENSLSDKRSVIRHAEVVGLRLADEEAWMMKQSGQRYTLQLLAMEKPAVERVTVEHNMPGKLHYFRVEAGGKSLIAATYGSFASRSEAVAEQKRLAGRLGIFKPWARSFSSIQQVIRQTDNKLERKAVGKVDKITSSKN